MSEVERGEKKEEEIEREKETEHSRLPLSGCAYAWRMRPCFYTIFPPREISQSTHGDPRTMRRPRTWQMFYALTHASVSSVAAAQSPPKSQFFFFMMGNLSLPSEFAALYVFRIRKNIRKIDRSCSLPSCKCNIDHVSCNKNMKLSNVNFSFTLNMLFNTHAVKQCDKYTYKYSWIRKRQSIIQIHISYIE